jgi:hypothetical protein
MADEPENLTLKQLALLRSEMQAGFAALTKDMGQCCRRQQVAPVPATLQHS